MWPILEIAEFYFPTYNLILVFGILCGLATLFWSARCKRTTLQFLADHFFSLLLGSILIARLTEIWLNNYSLISFPFFWQENGGFNFCGGIVGFLITLAVICRRNNENFLAWLDLSVLSITSTLIFHHIGTFFSGANYGISTVLPWGVTFTQPDSAVLTTIPIHPVQIYSAIFTLILFISAVVIFRRTREHGKTGVFLLITLSLAYFFLDFLRGDSEPIFGVLRASQYFMIAFIIVSAILALKMRLSTFVTSSHEFQIKK